MAVFTSNIDVHTETFAANRKEMLALVDGIHRLKDRASPRLPPMVFPLTWRGPGATMLMGDSSGFIHPSSMRKVFPVMQRARYRWLMLTVTASMNSALRAGVAGSMY